MIHFVGEIPEGIFIGIGLTRADVERLLSGDAISLSLTDDLPDDLHTGVAGQLMIIEWSRRKEPTTQ